MSEVSPTITDQQRDFIARQQLFFVATAAGDSAIGLSPKGMDGFRLLGPDLVGYVDVGDEGHETRAHLAANGRITIMVCAFDQQPPLILRLHGKSRAILPQDDEWDIAARALPDRPGATQIVMVSIQSIEEDSSWTGPAAATASPPEPVDRHTKVDPDWVPAVLNFWLNEVGPEGWFDSTEEMDARLTHLFRALWEAQKDKPAGAFLEDADTALAAIVLFDQFPRNMFRHEARAFATDPLALEIARAALDRSYDEEFVEGARSFFYLPFMHSENLADQDRCVELLSKPGFEENLRFAKMHRDIIARFGRFPHRNKALGRETRPEEADAVAEGSGW